MFFCALRNVKSISGICFLVAILAGCGGGGSTSAVPDPISITEHSSALGATQSSAFAIARSSSISIAANPVPSSIAIASSGGASRANNSFAAASSILKMSSVAASNKSSSMAISASKAASVANNSSKPRSSLNSSSSVSCSPLSNTLSGSVSWVPPNARENGDALYQNEIGGYQLRYKVCGASGFKYLDIPGSSTTTYFLDATIAGYLIEIATYDSNNLFSDFVPIAVAN
jgi:hypothetical protein